jgi:hypothetical protein
MIRVQPRPATFSAPVHDAGFKPSIPGDIATCEDKPGPSGINNQRPDHGASAAVKEQSRLRHAEKDCCALSGYTAFG